MLTKTITSRLLFFTLVGFLVSCQHPRQDYIRGILSSGCFWDVLDKDFNVKKATYTYRLLPDGTCYKYRYHYVGQQKQNSVSPVDATKGEVDVRWRLQSDSVVTIEKVDYKVLKVDNTTVWLETPTLQSFLLKKNCSTFITD